jgi:hypothetical protein
MWPLYYDWDGQPITMEQWSALRKAGGIHVGLTRLGQLGDVSTVWLGLDHGYPAPWGNDERPVIFETMVFGGPLAGEMVRYTSREEAKFGHDFMVMRLTNLAGEPERAPSLIHNGGKPRGRGYRR